MTPDELAYLLRPISSEQALTSYRALKDTNKPRAGLKTLDRHFFGQRLLTKTKGKSRLSFYQAYHDPNTIEYLRLVCNRYKRDPTKIINLYGVFQMWWGSVNQFKPQIAKAIYQQLSPKVAIMDFSAGWGGRALGAMALGIPYIGIDSNLSLASCYEKIQTYEPSASLTMLFQPSETVDFSSLQYDCVFTSPPYYTQEIYENMPEYSSLDDFLIQFLVPVIHNAWKYLIRPGTLALNLPRWLYLRLSPLLTLPPLSERLPMPYITRFTKDGKTSSHEWVYVWRKP